MATLTASNIADYFLYVANESGSYISNLKLQKLVFYAQAWHLAIYENPLFEEEFEAWVRGPVIPALYREYQHFSWKPILKEVQEPKFSPELQDFLNDLIEVYFFRDALELEMMTHREEPWIKARNGLPMSEPSNAIISKQSMKDFYKSRAA